MSAVAETGAQLNLSVLVNVLMISNCSIQQDLFQDCLEWEISKPLLKKPKTALMRIWLKNHENMMSGKFTLVDMKNQFEMMNSMGPMQQVLSMILDLEIRYLKRHLK